MKYTIHYTEQADGTYNEEVRRGDDVEQTRTNVDKETADAILNITSPLFRDSKTLREMLEWDAEYVEWLSQMGNDPEDTDPTIVAIRKIIRYQPLS